MRRGLCRLCSLALVLSAFPSELASQELQTLDFPDKIELSNGIVQIGVSPQAGRIVSFGYRGGENVLRVPSVNEYEETLRHERYKRYGGDRVLNSQQSDWKFSMNRDSAPPDESIDGTPWRLLRKNDSSIVIQSELSAYMGVRCTRSIELSQEAPEARITSELEQVEPSVFPVLIWTVTLVKPPRFSLLDAKMRYPVSGRLWNDLRLNSCRAPGVVVELGGDAVLFTPQDCSSKPKAGTMGNWLAAIYEKYVFVQKAGFSVDGCYPDGASLEVFSDGFNYELETLSPQVHLKPGQKIEHKVIWRLMANPGGSNEDAATRLIDTIEGRAGAETRKM